MAFIKSPHRGFVYHVHEQAKVLASQGGNKNRRKEAAHPSAEITSQNESMYLGPA